MSKTVFVVAGVAIVVAGVAAVAWSFKKDQEDRKAIADKKKAVAPVNRPMAATDSLGLTVYPEMYEIGRLDRQDACAWLGCIGELDANGRCTGCPQM